MDLVSELAFGEWTPEGLGELASHNVPFTNRYVFNALLGLGTTGAVFTATDRVLARKVAVKIFWPRSQFYSTMRGFESFRREAQLLAGIRHPNICAVHDFGVARGILPWFAMELVDGETLRNRIDGWASGSSVEFASILRIAIEVATGTAVLHSADLHQLDIKPENILINAADNLKLIDFATGYERLKSGRGKGGYRFGTAEYLAPEIISEDLGPPSAASDMFSLGVLIVEMLCFQNPLEGLSIRDRVCEALGIKKWLADVRHTTIAFPADSHRSLAEHGRFYAESVSNLDVNGLMRQSRFILPQGLMTLISAMLSTDPSRRPQQGSEVATALKSISQAPLGATVFISHSHADKKRFVESFVNALISRGLNIWYDSRDLRVGESFWDRIGTEVDRSMFVIVVLSKNSLRSAGVGEELRIARLQNVSRVKVLPILIDELPIESLPPDLRARQVLRFPLPSARRGFETALEGLVRDIKELGTDQTKRG